ncbi:MAG: RagB/SusD family nutrient uptake outer membrane protein [Prevotella sp.]|nr:RagB/SusD family nutrient uptake outer membrane protein [Prevotella sp.]
MRKHAIYKKVRGLAALALLSPSALFFSSCGDFLEIEPQDRIVLEKFWNEKSDVDNVLVSCYSALQTENVVSRMMVWGEFRSDNIEKGTNISNVVNLQRVINENIDASNGYTTYNEFYGVINRCNTVLLYAPQVAEKDPAYSETMLRSTEAEAKALRALCYFYLIRTFRDVPYITEAYTDDNQPMEIAATPFNEILDSLISDLESVKGDAMVRYPSTQALYQTGRITRDAIYSMLCEMYLWKQDYQNCVKYADLVIDSKKDYYKEKYSGRNLDQDGRLNGYPIEASRYGTSNEFGRAFYNIFGQTNSSVGVGDSDEIIFELVYMNSSGMMRNGAVNSLYGNATDPQGYVGPAAYLIYDENSSSNLFKKYDARYYENMYSLGSKQYGINKYVRRMNDITVSGTTTNSYMLTVTSPYPKDDNTSNWIIYRLTDIMLLKAEALTEMGSDGSSELSRAFELVQAVNNRSILQTIITDSLQAKSYVAKKETMQELVLEERQRELMFEGKRWYDLVRRSLRDGNTDVLTGYLGYKDLPNSAVALRRLKKIDAIFWPYNLEEMRVNNALVQNPAFGSGENSSFTNTSGN